MSDRITPIFKWVETRLDEGAWFRRIYLIAATSLMWKTTMWAQGFAEVNASHDGLQVAAIIGAVSAVPGVISSFAFKQYLESRGT